ncbi:hypothetical protein [Hamadaea tsunoensis]|uniref:hypothetical protein n=1 Tax=Hamadaea tsunoensis TaxID=53368 RepID=UPI00040A0700|nr:hypothetical protein [Hamadaea tsunoensis]
MTARCLICGWPAGTGAECIVCHSPLAGAEDARRRARLAWDLRAAHRAAAGDERALLALVAEVRSDDPVEPADILAAGMNLRWEPDRHYDHSLGAIANLLSALVAGDLEVLVFVCLTADGIELHRAEASGSRLAHMADPGPRSEWAELTAALPTDPLRRRFVLAGGIGTNEPADPVAVVADILSQLPDLDALLISSRRAIVVVDGCPDWLPLSRVRAEAVTRYRASTCLKHPLTGPDDSAAALVDSLVRQAPVGVRHELVLIRPGDDGVLQLEMATVLRPGEKSTAVNEVEIYAPVGPTGPVALPFVIRPTAVTEPADWEMVELMLADVPRGRRSRIRVSLNDRAQFALDGVPVVSGPSSTWLELLHRMPRRLVGGPIDVVFAVELVDGPAAEARLDLVRATVDAIASEVWDPELIRVGAIGYFQHGDLRREPETHVQPLTAPALAKRALAAWRTRSNVDDYAACVEEALADAAELAWRDEAHRFLVTFGSRPPYLRDQLPAYTNACRKGLDWVAAYNHLAARGVRMIGVLGQPEWPAPRTTDDVAWVRLHEAWQALGAHASFAQQDTEIADILHAVQVAYVTPSTPFAYAVATSPSRNHPERTS